MNEFVCSIAAERYDELYHHGILGMHWGIRRYQPYGQGYDPEHEGKEIGLAARLAGGGSSYSSMYGRGSKKKSIVDAVKGFGKKASKASAEGFERLNYAGERMSEGINKGYKKAKKGLIDYASTYGHDGRKAQDADMAELLSGSDFSTIAKFAARKFGSDAKTKVSSLKNVSRDDILSSLGSGRSAFENAFNTTKTNTKDFARNARLTASLLAGAFDPTSSASQIIEGRSSNYSNPRSISSIASTRSSSALDSLSGRGYTKAASSFSNQDRIREAGGIANKGLSSLLDIGERREATGGTVNLGSGYKSEYKNKREQEFGNSPYGRTYGGASTWDADKYHLGNARSVLLSDLAARNVQGSRDISNAKSLVDSVAKQQKSYNEMLNLSKRLYQDPYEYNQTRKFLSKYGIQGLA